MEGTGRAVLLVLLEVTTLLLKGARLLRLLEGTSLLCVIPSLLLLVLASITL